MGYTLPLPPFRHVSTLSVDELIQVAARFILISDNLASPDPQFRDHWTLTLGDEEPSLPPINVFGILPNGHYVLIMHEKGVFTLWDVRPTGPSGRRRLVARHETSDETVSMEYTTEGDSGTCIIVAALSEETAIPTIFVFQFQLDFSTDESSHGVPRVIQSDLANYCIDHIGYFARIALQDGLCLAWYNSEEKVIASILDYRNSKRVDLETDITSTTSPDCCLYHGSLIFHHDKLTNAVVSAYFHITEHLKPVPNNSRLWDVDMISKAPDRSAVLPLHSPDSSSKANQEPNLVWNTIHPTNTPNANTLCGSPSIFATETMSPTTYGRIPHLSARWMEPQTTLEMLRTGANLDTPVFRTWIDLEGPTAARDDGFEFLISTTCGLRMLWVTYAEADSDDLPIEEVLYLIPLLTPDERTRGHAGKRILRLPTDLFDILTMDFSDESGTLVIASKSGDTSDERSSEVSQDSGTQLDVNQVLHIFQY
ncbi:hypothetical protein M407DRAFT_20949 [Tulasnella calospora MUT 4182]|uniref:Uncharacterized protein n=1 Tax=Tulasnella calospora MUT 4182 TaxID=1051891 RepID=A0A0C3M890_9AGAM|nr:hypothetical protein M407DRAFT_20949 [Tulasnella calospora MUT 4182]